MKGKLGTFLLGLTLFSTLVGHWNHFTLSPRGVHVWRQCNTLAVAKNFFEEDMDLFHPRVDHRKGTNGVTGMAFPLYEWMVGLTYQIWGFSHANHRILMWLIMALGTVGLYKIGNRLFQTPWISACMSFAYAWSPEIYYHSINALPDVLAMSLVIWAIYFYLGHQRTSIWWSVCLITLAGMVKLQFILFAPILLVHSLFRKNIGKAFWMLFLGVFSLGAVTNWYIHSIRLRYANQLQDYGLFLNPAKSWKVGWNIFLDNLVMDLPEQILGYAVMLTALIGAFVYVRRQNGRTHLVWLACILLFGIFHILELQQMKYHAYYMMPYVFFGAVLTGYFLHLYKHSKWMAVCLILIPIQIFHSANKINPRYEDANSEIPSEFLNDDLLIIQELAKGEHRALVGPDQSGCIYFYYLGVKGWNIFGENQLETKTEIQKALRDDQINCLIIKDLNQDNKDKYSEIFPEIYQVGSFTVMKKKL